MGECLRLLLVTGSSVGWFYLQKMKLKINKNHGQTEMTCCQNSSSNWLNKVITRNGTGTGELNPLHANVENMVSS